ncbi:VpsD family glycosyltransferase [Vibrio alfacsensis]|uniref:VpsD family glycosyltransferase n=1 Tax=Vibrio alfacsensis TaxID=1074311 RepID=UPI002ADD8559|nr:VpsD family glycosyltransferase [Vibrio alfacsensis]WQE78100.1 VpsD family glycosyltransferase [Vibrio alfacsensis]
MKKILLIVPLSTLDLGSSTKGGVDSVCQILIKDLIEREYINYHIRILAFDQTSKANSNSPLVNLSPYVEILHVPISEKTKGIKRPSIISNLKRIQKEISTFKPDLVHSHLAPWLLGVRGPKRVATLHTYKNICRKPVSFLNDIFYAKLFPWLCNFYIDHYTCVGKSLALAVKNDVKKTTSIIGNPLNPHYFEQTKNFKKPTNLKFITCALLTKRKRIDSIIKLIILLYQTGIDVELTIIGPNVDNQYWQELHDLIEKENASQYITFLGSKNTVEIKELYEHSNIGIFLSSEETFGLAPLEMLASGLPTISSSVGIIEERSEFFERLGTCIIDPTQEEEALAKVIAFASQPPVIDRFALKNEFSVNAVNNHYFNIYKTLLNA